MEQKRILVVDDNSDIVRMVMMRLQQEGYATRGATSGREALQLLERELPDLVLLDVVMPGLSGFEVCQQIKSDPRTHHLPVVMLSARDSTGDKVHGLDQGADEYVTKPVRLVELVARVRALLRLKGLEQELAEKNAQLERHLSELSEASLERTRLLEQLKQQNQQLESHALAERQFLDLVNETLRGPLARLEHVCEQVQNESTGGRIAAAIKVMVTEARRLQGSLARLPNYLRRRVRPADRRRRGDRRQGAGAYGGSERRQGERRRAARRRTDPRAARAASS
ncbi:MAG TPA: response regulator [Acidobacteriota bacterium]